MSLSSISIPDLPTPSHSLTTSDGLSVPVYIAGEVIEITNAFLIQAACDTCIDDGIHATDGSGPYDCYACGKKAKDEPTSATKTEA